MGIFGFYRFVGKYAPKAVKTVKAAELAGTIVAVDATLAIYQWYAIGQTRGILHNGKVSNHIQGMFLRTVYLLSRGITPVYVFDGPPPDEKRATIDARRAKRVVNIYHGAFDECKELLTRMGVSYIIAESDAEATCAQLVKSGKCNYVMSRDSDSLVFGAKALIKDINLGTNKAEIVDLGALLAELGLNMAQFVDLCVLLGSDYNRPIMGPAKALAAVRGGNKLTEEQTQIVKTTRNIYTREYNRGDVNPGKLDAKLLGEFLLSFGISDEKIKTGISKIPK